MKRDSLFKHRLEATASVLERDMTPEQLANSHNRRILSVQLSQVLISITSVTGHDGLITKPRRIRFHALAPCYQRRAQKSRVFLV